MCEGCEINGNKSYPTSKLTEQGQSMLSILVNVKAIFTPSYWMYVKDKVGCFCLVLCT